eukprot:m.55404 g.55404  ORF g.55404 m.55404 type:complete len:327 (+) comp12528_c0_seq1:96-1076(+)
MHASLLLPLLLLSLVVVAFGAGHQVQGPRLLPPVVRGLQGFWAFQEPAGEVRIDSVHGYELQEQNGATARVECDAAQQPCPFGSFALHVDYGQRLFAARAAVPALANISGPDAHVTVAVWVRLANDGTHGGGMMVAGMWQENTGCRQYAVFMNHTAGCMAKNGMVAHLSAEGVPESGHRYCESAACGATSLARNAWHCLVHTYDGVAIRAYVNGTLDNDTTVEPGRARTADDVLPRPTAQQRDQNAQSRNPLLYPDPEHGFPRGGIYAPSAGKGAGLAVGYNMIHQGGGVGPGVPGNKFHGDIGGLAIYNEALDQNDVTALCKTKL